MFDIPTSVTELVATGIVSQAAFLLVVAVTLVGAAMAVVLRRIIHNIMGLIISLFGVAGIFIFLNSEFLALMEILVYVGAICISIIFAIMLSDPMYKEIKPRDEVKMVLSLLTSGLLLLSFGGLVYNTQWKAADNPVNDWALKTVGHRLLTQFDLAFELISLVLLIAILGAIMIAGQGRRKET